MKCICKGKIIILEKDLNWDRPSKKIIYCSKCQKKYTWREYQSMRADKLIEMMRDDER
ncbi:MAG: hypothetical protein ABIL06_23050 [Pseudomonadota bacterium]